jgi:AbrB family looped-hinge helix DNA binding protein
MLHRRMSSSSTALCQRRGVDDLSSGAQWSCVVRIPTMLSECRSGPFPRGKTILASTRRLLYLFTMETVTLSSKYQVVIPRAVRVSLGLKPGMKLQVIEYHGRVEFLPVRKAFELRGLLKGLDPVIERESDRL